VPIGILQSSWGGTPIKTWMSLPSLRAEPAIEKTVTEWETALAKHQAARNQPELQAQYFAAMKEWEEQVDKPYREALKTYEARVAAAQAAGEPAPPRPQRARPEPAEPDPIAFPYPSKRPQAPSITFNAMIAPLVPYALKGFLWYQGEADVSRAAEYRVWLPRLITGWRELWAQGEAPFLIVQLPGHGRDIAPVANDGIPFLREAQASALRLPQVGLAITADIGDAADVHPDNKSHTAARLALLARELVYGEKIAGLSPAYDSHAIDGATVRVRFTRVGSGLVVGTAPWRPKGAPELSVDRLRGFYLAGADQKWVEATATIEGHDTVVLQAPGVAVPISVRYGWAYTPKINLYSRDGLPAGPFRTDNWPR
jgi:sialate O-acetylesterase